MVQSQRKVSTGKVAKMAQKEDDTFPIDQIREMFDGEWVLVEVTALLRPDQPLRGRILAHHKNRMEIAKKTRKFHDTNPGKMSHTLFAGDAIPKGVVVVLAESRPAS